MRNITYLCISLTSNRNFDIMHAISLIARHIDRALITDIIHQIDTVCAFTGERITEGIKKKDAIGANFTDFAYVKHESDYVSLDFVLCTKDIIKKITDDGEEKVSGLRNFSFIATETELRFLKREEILDALLSINQTPFVVCVTEGGKKHITFKADVNFDTGKFIVAMDSGSVFWDRTVIDAILPIVKRWYSLIPERKQEATWFTKAEILSGDASIKKINDYGIDKYIEESNILRPYFNSQLMRLLTFVINKHD